ncbi:MAG: hypothetical protein PHD81_01600 [Candidatus Nanoarchaeia archaeon]|nr:hypothetical protein [Candidatus Nanoarchaeia archaeon]MDD5587783.1 hypothetical protein [Candidatus Nanoarchaeia archaeon]
MKKRLDFWENEVQKALKHVNKGEFGLVSLIGSKNPTHDIDLVTLPSPKTTNSQFYDQNHQLIQTLQYNLMGKGLRIIPFPNMESQHEIVYLSDVDGQKVPLHNLAYLDAESFRRFNPKGFKESVEHVIPIYGSLDVLSELPEANYDPLTWTLIGSDRTLDNLPEDLFNQKMKHILDYVSKHGFGEKLPSKINLSPKEVHKLTLNFIKAFERN